MFDETWLNCQRIVMVNATIVLVNKKSQGILLHSSGICAILSHSVTRAYLRTGKISAAHPAKCELAHTRVDLKVRHFLRTLRRGG